MQLPRFILKPKKKIRSTLLKNIEKTPTLNKKDYIERQAIKLIRKYNARNPFELAYALNINVRFYDFNKLKGFYTYYKRNRYIGINQNLSKIEQALCCAHEIGHDQLHRHLTYYMKDYDFFTNIKTEYQANLMAAHILIPDDLLDKYSKYNYTIEQIAAIENLDQVHKCV